MKVHLLVSDGVFDLGLAALTDTLGLANAMAGSLPQAPAPIEITLVAVRRGERTEVVDALVGQGHRQQSQGDSQGQGALSTVLG